MRRFVLSSTVAVAVLAGGSGLAVAQTGEGSEQRPAGKAEQAGPDSRAFITKMAIGNMAEIELGKMATQRASNADVKQFGQHMVKDHTQANNELKQVASQLNIQLPTELDAKHKQLSERLSKLEGEEFDRAYMQAMVQNHKQTVNDLRAFVKGRGSEAVGTTGDPTGNRAIEQWASKTLPTVEEHLKEAQQIEQKVRKGGA